MSRNSEKETAAPKVVPKIKPSKLPFELRYQQRVDIRANEGVEATVLWRDQRVKASVFDISSTGMCLVLGSDYLTDKKILDTLEIEIVMPSGFSFKSEYCICWMQVDGQKLKVGFRALRKQESSAQLNILPIAEAYPIVGYIYKDFFYYEKSIIKLIAISHEYAIVHVFDNENIFFLNQTIEILFSLHTTSSDKLRGLVMHVEHLDKNALRLEIKVAKMGKNLEKDIVNHLTLNPNLSPEDIRGAGFRIKKISNNFKFRFVKTQDEYLKVLNLRLLAYRAAGKVNELATAADMVAPLDYISRILVAYHGEKVVASVSLSFPPDENTILDTEKALPNGYSNKIPPKSKMIEIARLCTHNEYRRGDLLLRMFEHIYRVFASSGRKYLISSCDDKLWAIYKGLGFKKVGLRYDHPYLKGIQHDVILIGLSTGTSGYGINPFSWWFLYASMTEFISMRMKIQRSLPERVVFHIYKIISKFFKKITKNY